MPRFEELGPGDAVLKERSTMSGRRAAAVTVFGLTRPEVP
jgi:hypothetical protein